MELLLPLFLCRLYQSKTEWKKAFFGFCHDVCIAAAVILIYPHPILWVPVVSYRLLYWYFEFFLNIFLTPKIWRFALRPASFFDSILKFIPALLAGLALVSLSLLGFRHEFHRPAWAGLLIFCGGIVMLGRKINKLESKECEWNFPNEINLFLNPKYPLLRKTIRFLGKKRFEIDRKGKPHIIFLILESFRAKNVGCLGAEVPLSPNFDALAKKGILFTQFHSISNLTSSCSIASLFGIPPRLGQFGEYDQLSLFGLPKIMQKHGYHPALIQGGHIAFDHGPEFFLKNGFKTLIGKKEIQKAMPNATSSSWGVHDEYVLKYASDWLKQQNQPTFLSLYTISNHHPWITPEGKEGFLESFAYTDRCLTQFLPENAILFIFGDHGQESRSSQFEINRHLYQENLHVPLLIYAPHLKPQLIDTPCSQIDLLPTVLDLLNLQGPHHSLGQSLMRDIPPQPLYFSHPFDEQFRACRKENWKLILDGDLNELYDLAKDPCERTPIQNDNLITSLKLDTDAYQSHVQKVYEDNCFAEENETSSQDLHLSISDSLEFNDAALERLGNNLTTLALSNCLMLSDEGFRLFLNRYGGLEKLTLHGLDLTAQDWPQAPHLIHLKITECPRLKGDWLKKLPSLRNLILSIDEFDDEDIPPLKDLWALHLSHMHQITDRSLKPLFEDNHSLLSVCIENCPQITDETLEAMHGRVLCQMSLIGLPRITDRGLQALTKLPLQSLILKDCSQVTAAGLQLLEAKGTQILLAQCPQIAPEAVRTLVSEGHRVWWDAQELKDI